MVRTKPLFSCWESLYFLWYNVWGANKCCHFLFREIFPCPASSLPQWTNTEYMCGFQNLVSIFSLACFSFILLDGLRSICKIWLVYVTLSIAFSCLTFKGSINSNTNSKREMETMFGKKLNYLESRIFELENLNEDFAERKDKSECRELELRSKLSGSEEIYSRSYNSLAVS